MNELNQSEETETDDQIQSMIDQVFDSLAQDHTLLDHHPIDPNLFNLSSSSTYNPIHHHPPHSSTLTSIPNSLSTLLQEIEQATLPSPSSKSKSTSTSDHLHIHSSEPESNTQVHQTSNQIKSSKSNSDQISHQITRSKSNSHQIKPSNQTSNHHQSSSSKKPSTFTRFPNYPRLGDHFKTLNRFKFSFCQAAWSHGHHIHVRSTSLDKTRITYACFRDRSPPKGVNCEFRMIVRSNDGKSNWKVTDLNLTHTFHEPKPGEYLPNRSQRDWFDRMKEEIEGDESESEEEEEEEEKEEERERSPPAIGMELDEEEEEEIKELEPEVEWKAFDPSSLKSSRFDEFWSFGGKCKKRLNREEKKVKGTKVKVKFKKNLRSDRESEEEEEEEEEEEIEVISGGNRCRDLKEIRMKDPIEVNREKRLKQMDEVRILPELSSSSSSVKGLRSSLSKRRRKVIIESDDDEEEEEEVKVKVKEVTEIEEIDLDENLWFNRRTNPSSSSSNKQKKKKEQNSNESLSERSKGFELEKKKKKAKIEEESLESYLSSCHFKLINLLNELKLMGIKKSNELRNLNRIGYDQIMRLIIERVSDQVRIENEWMKEVLWNRMRNRSDRRKVEVVVEVEGKKENEDDQIWKMCWCWPKGLESKDEGICEKCKFLKKRKK